MLLFSFYRFVDFIFNLHVKKKSTKAYRSQKQNPQKEVKHTFSTRSHTNRQSSFKITSLTDSRFIFFRYNVVTIGNEQLNSKINLKFCNSNFRVRIIPKWWTFGCHHVIFDMSNRNLTTWLNLRSVCNKADGMASDLPFEIKIFRIYFLQKRCQPHNWLLNDFLQLLLLFPFILYGNTLSESLSLSYIYRGYYVVISTPKNNKTSKPIVTVVWKCFRNEKAWAEVPFMLLYLIVTFYSTVK